MSTNATQGQKPTDDSIDLIEELDFVPKTSRRAVYESFSFSRVGDIVFVINESSGADDVEGYIHTIKLDARDVAMALHLHDIEDQTVSADGGEVLSESDDNPPARPDDCECSGSALEAEYNQPCWPCYRDGFETPNPAAHEGA